jgi:hypothetical protein
VEPLDADGRANVDEALQSWRQGDCVLGEQWFVFRIDPDAPLTAVAAAAASEDTENAESEVHGFAVVTQTCDIVRSCADRPFIEVCPLVEVDEALLREIQRSRRPNYAFVPGMAKRRLVVDLDRVMTIEKPVIAAWERIEGCLDDTDARRFALAPARKRARIAFPYDFVELATPLMSRMSSKHDRNSPEGRALRSLREIRVRAAPSWDAAEVQLTTLFIQSDDPRTVEDKSWHQHLQAWRKLIAPHGRFVTIDTLVSTLDDLTARDHVESDPLDLDYLSTRTG